MNLALTQAALIRRQQQVARDVFTLLAFLESLDTITPMDVTMTAAQGQALDRLRKFAATGDADADAAIEQSARPGRLARIAESERHESWCIAHRQPVRWLPDPCWWYHHPPISGVPESSRCSAMWAARAPAGRAA